VIRARLPWYALAALALVALAYALAFAGLTLCSPSPLPGDEAWTRWMQMREAVGIVAGREARCFYRDQATVGARALGLASQGGSAVLALAALAALWETAGRAGRRAWRRWRGGHAILAGEPGEIEPFAAARKGIQGSVFVARDGGKALSIARQKPFADVIAFGSRRQAFELMRRVGAAKAVFVAAVTGNDLDNYELAEAALEQGGTCEIVARLEQPSVRALRSDTLRRAGERLARPVTVISLRQMQARTGLAHAMPGSYRYDGAKRVHIAVCGAGPLLQEMAFLIVRQGYGLETTAPLVTILRTGRSDFAAGALELLERSGVAEVRLAAADGTDGGAIDRAFVAIAAGQGQPPLSAVHCCEEEPGAALALACRLERVMVDLDLPIPPLVVHGDGPEAPGDTGMVRVARPAELAEAHRQSLVLDRRAIALHAAYVAGQRATRGATFGTMPAERDWKELAESLRDDNRNGADHINYKLARLRMSVAAGLAPATPTEAELDELSALEHARWMASRGLAGYRHGPTRDDTLLFHPDMKPYSELDDDGRRKDRDQARAMLAQLAAAGESPVRVRPLAFLGTDGIEALLARAAKAAQIAGELPLIAVALDNAAGVTVAERALAARLAVEAYVAKAPERVFADDEGLRRRAAQVLRQVRAIRVVRSADAGAVLAANARVVADADGKLDKALLA
jgi:hypothetical protein